VIAASSHHRRFRGLANNIWYGVFCAWLSLQALADTPGVRPANIAVSARGEIELVPDLAALSVTFSRQGDSIAPLKASVTADVTDLLEGLDKAGVEASAIDSTRIMLQPRYRFDRQTQEQISDGYRLDRTVVVDPIRVEQLATLLTLATASGANRIDPPRLYSSAREQAYLTALQRAMDQATARAEVLAESAGGKLGTALHVTTLGSPQRGPIPMARAAMSTESEDGSYQPGTLTVVATVSVEFELIH